MNRVTLVNPRQVASDVEAAIYEQYPKEAANTFAEQAAALRARACAHPELAMLAEDYDAASERFRRIAAERDKTREETLAVMRQQQQIFLETAIQRRVAFTDVKRSALLAKADELMQVGDARDAQEIRSIISRDVQRRRREDK